MWHSRHSNEVIAKLNSSLSAGLSQTEANKRLLNYGLNQLPEPKPRSLFFIFVHQFFSPLIYLLLIAVGIAVLIGEVHDAAVILVVVILNSIIGAYQEWRAEQSLEALRRLSKLKARVLRGGYEQTVDALELVPGDILVLSAGDAVPADGRLIETSTIAAAEAALTGESLPVFKSITALAENTPLADRHNMVYAGTHISLIRSFVF